MRKPPPFTSELAEEPTILRGVLEATVGPLPDVEVEDSVMAYGRPEPIRHGRAWIPLPLGGSLESSPSVDGEGWLDLARAALAMHLHTAAQARAARISA